MQPDPSWIVRDTTAKALVGYASALQHLLDDTSSQVRRSATNSLKFAQGDDEHVIEALLNTTFDNNWSVRESAADALSISLIQVDTIGERLEQMLQQFEPIAQYDLRGNTSIFSALQEIAKKVEN